ncbi:MAG: polysaccharide deacetylase family protein [Prolixibacteraceae bacterium]|nr:polysaccharide deacetylase family protein [Prolixibacteraceae bacterium]
MKLFFLLLICLVLGGGSFAQQKQVCFTFDDLPVVGYGVDQSTQNQIFTKLVSQLTTLQIPAIGFVNESKLFRSDRLIPEQAALLNQWINCGLELGNHTFSHPDFNKVTLDVFARDVIKGERKSKEWLRSQGKNLTYFRHPFLHCGNSKLKADSLERFLTGRGYQVAPVTIDNEDYLFALAYQRAHRSRDTTLANQIGNDFISYMGEKLSYYERQSSRLFGRDIRHILLLHANRLNADYVDELADLFRKNNYRFVSLSETLKDLVYQTPITVFGNWGISWIDRWALSMGKKGDFFKGEPETPEYIKKLAE